MKLTYQGKTKDVYQLTNGDYLLAFKDDVTGVDGVFDPGANTVGLSIEGAGLAGLKLTTHFFEKLNAAGVPTHFVSSDLKARTMTVKPAEVFGNGLEVICRFRAVGSFLKRYGLYAEEAQPLDAFVEVTLKDDDREDPPISKDALNMLNILTTDEYETLKALTQQIANIVKDELATKDIELYDIKFEFGRDKETNEIILIDEISGGNMRAYKDGLYIEPIALEQLFLNS